MQIKHFIGIDVSKDTLDLSVVVDGRSLQHYCIKNRTVEIKSTFSKIMRALGATIVDTIFCMKHTGMYNLPLVKWLQTHQGKMWLESGVHIRKTLGVVRGKNDKIDSARIAMYAYINRRQIRIWNAPRKLIERIAALLSQRSRLNKAKKQLNTANQEQKLFLDKDIMRSLNKYIQMAALSAIQMQGDLQEYYKRKVSEGKNKMSVLNAIRNKLVLRIFACVNQNREYEKIYYYKLV